MVLVKLNIFFDNLLQNSIIFFALLNPIGISAVVLSLLGQDVSKLQMKQVAFKSTLTILVAFFIVLVGGNFILSVFGINTNSIKVIGGIVLILMALEMIRGNKQKTTSSSDDIKADDDLSVIPIGIPIIFGPGLFSTIIIVKQEAQNFYDITAIVIAFLINAILIYLAFRNSLYIRNYLGQTGQNVVTKIMGLIVGAISVQFIISGIVNLVKTYL